MSRANAKICRVHDQQGRYSDVILTKKDCDLISKALLNTIVNLDMGDENKELAIKLSGYFKELTLV